jgi:hypothetical protein
MIRRHVTSDRLTGKPEVIPETESLHYLQGSQGRSRRRTLSTRSRNFLIGVQALGVHDSIVLATLVLAKRVEKPNGRR